MLVMGIGICLVGMAVIIVVVVGGGGMTDIIDGFLQHL